MCLCVCAPPLSVNNFLYNYIVCTYVRTVRTISCNMHACMHTNNTDIHVLFHTRHNMYTHFFFFFFHYLVFILFSTNFIVHLHRSLGFYPKRLNVKITNAEEANSIQKTQHNICLCSSMSRDYYGKRTTDTEEKKKKRKNL